MAFQINPGFISSIADDPAATAAGYLTPSRHNLPATVSGADVGGIPYCPTASSIATSSGLIYNGTNLSIGGQVLPTGGITIVGNGSFDAVATNIGFVQYATRELAVRVGSGGKVIKMDSLRLGVGSGTSFGFGSNADVTLATWDANFSRLSSGVVGVGTGAAGSSAGTIQCKHNSSDGTAGVTSFGPAAPASITVKDGIIVAIS